MVNAGIDCVKALFYQSGDDMRTVGIEVVAWAVEIYGDKEYAVEAIFGAIGLRLDEEHLFCEAVRRVCLLRVTVPKVIFPEGDRGKLGIRADGADSDELSQFAKACLVDELDTHHKVLVEEFARVLTVSTDSAYDGGEVNNNIGLHIVIHSDDIGEVDEVVILDFGDEDIFAAAFVESLYNVGA
jgi:hypothetical protein